MSELVDRFGNPEDWRVFTEDEKERIWEQFFGKRWSLNHIAENFEVRKEKIVQVIEDPEMNSRHTHSSGENKRSRVIVPLPVNLPVKREYVPSKVKGKAAS